MNTFFRNISIATKIYIIPIANLILFSAIIAYAATVLNAGFTSLEEARSEGTKRIMHADEIRADLLEGHALLYRIVTVATSSISGDAYEDLIIKLKEKNLLLGKNITDFEDLNTFPEYTKIKSLYTEYLDVINNTYDLLSDAALATMFLVDAERHYGELQVLTKKLAEHVSNEVDVDFARIEKNVQTDEYKLLILVISVLVLSIVLSIIIAKAITGPLRRISVAMNKLSQKEYTISLPSTDGRNEISKMALAVEVFSEAMQRSDDMTRTQQEEAARKEENVRLISDLVTSSRSLADEVNTNVSTIAASVHEMSGSSEEIRQQTQRSTQMVDKAVEEGRLSEASMQELAQGATRIGEVMQVINDIADKTNLLALNASIEAARAGEAGRGFAVVADEVKKLSTQTSDATQNIQEQIQGVQNSVTHVINSMQNIRDAVHGIEEVSSSIGSAVEEQNTATHGISESMEQATQGVQGLSENINSIYETTSKS